jgi:hypothetical protein
MRVQESTVPDKVHNIRLIWYELKYFSAVLVMLAFCKSGLVQMRLVPFWQPIIQAILHHLTKIWCMEAKYLLNSLPLIQQ